MIRILLLSSCLLLALHSNAQQRPRLPRPNRQVAAILDRQVNGNTASKGTSMHERLTGHAWYDADPATGQLALRDSVRYYYSHGRGMNHRVNASMMFNLNDSDYYFYANDLDVAVNNTPYVKIYYDSAIWAFVSPDTNNIPRFCEWGKYYRKYDSLGSLIRQEEHELNGAYRAADIVSNSWGQISSITYPPTDPGQPNISSYRQLYYNAAHQLTFDTSYYNGAPTYTMNYFTRYLYDSLGNLLQTELTRDERWSARAYRNERTAYDYDSLSRLVRVRSYYRYDDTSAETFSGTDSFTYTGNNRHFSWNYIESPGQRSAPVYVSSASYCSPNADTMSHYWVFHDSVLRPTFYRYRTIVYTRTPENNTATINDIYRVDSVGGLPAPLLHYIFYYDSYLDTTTPPPVLRPAIIAYPNPVTNNLTLNFKNPDNKRVDISVTNANGLNYSSMSQASGVQTSLPLNNLPPGLYFATIVIGGESRLVRFIKE